jgi:putative lipoprotein
VFAAALLCGCRSPICPWCGHDIRTQPPVETPKLLPAGVVMGEVTSLERGEPHPMAQIIVQLHDLSIFAGGQPRLIAETVIDRPTSLPVPFELPYPDDTVDASHDYSLSARIVVGNDDIFRTDTRYPVLTHGAPNRAQIVLMRIR